MPLQSYTNRWLDIDVRAQAFVEESLRLPWISLSYKSWVQLRTSLNTWPRRTRRKDRSPSLSPSRCLRACQCREPSWPTQSPTCMGTGARSRTSPGLCCIYGPTPCSTFVLLHLFLQIHLRIVVHRPLTARALQAIRVSQGVRRPGARHRNAATEAADH